MVYHCSQAEGAVAECGKLRVCVERTVSSVSWPTMQPPGGSYLFPSAAPLFPIAKASAPPPPPPTSEPIASSWLQNTSFSGTCAVLLLQRTLLSPVSSAPFSAPLPSAPPPPLPPSEQPPPPPPSVDSVPPKQRPARPRAADFFDEGPRRAPAPLDPIKGTRCRR